MMRSLFTGVSGLRTHQTKMDVIAHNIANVNTVGYKASRATFTEMFSQTLSGATKASDDTGRGGTNPRQIGLGVKLGSIDKIMTPGAAQRTDAPLDVSIEGSGFFIVGDGSGTYFTRAGAFAFDESFNLVNMSGLKVMGWDSIPDPENPGSFIIEKGNVKPINFGGDKQYVSPKSSTKIDFEGNLNAETDPIHEGTIQFYDSVGNSYSMDYKMEFDATAGTWAYSLGDMVYPSGNREKAIQATVDATGGVVITGPSYDEDNPAPDVTYAPVHEIKFDTNGKIDPATADLNINITANTGILIPEATFGNLENNIAVNFLNMTQFGNEKANAKGNTKDGNAPGKLIDLAIGSDGTISGSYTNGEVRVLAQIPVANFANPGGLQKAGDNLFIATLNSGVFDGVGQDVGLSGGQMLGGSLEMSNVDLSSEFTEMITTQRGFQANSRIITTSDEMLQELVNLKR